jgi:hypothetical protein
MVMIIIANVFYKFPYIKQQQQQAVIAIITNQPAQQKKQKKHCVFCRLKSNEK